jgi:hypothetical protein
MARVQACLIRQGQDAFDRTPERVCVPSRKSHRAVPKSGMKSVSCMKVALPTTLGNRRRSMTRREQDARLQIADVEDVAVGQ